jgi:hypothetical protein
VEHNTVKTGDAKHAMLGGIVMNITDEEKK